MGSLGINIIVVGSIFAILNGCTSVNVRHNGSQEQVPTGNFVKAVGQNYTSGLMAVGGVYLGALGQVAVLPVRLISNDVADALARPTNKLADKAISTGKRIHANSIRLLSDQDFEREKLVRKGEPVILTVEKPDQQTVLIESSDCFFDNQTGEHFCRRKALP